MLLRFIINILNVLKKSGKSCWLTWSEVWVAHLWKVNINVLNLKAMVNHQFQNKLQL